MIAALHTLITTDPTLELMLGEDGGGGEGGSGACVEMLCRAIEALRPAKEIIELAARYGESPSYPIRSN